MLCFASQVGRPNSIVTPFGIVAGSSTDLLRRWLLCNSLFLAFLEYWALVPLFLRPVSYAFLISCVAYIFLLVRVGRQAPRPGNDVAGALGAAATAFWCIV